MGVVAGDEHTHVAVPHLNGPVAKCGAGKIAQVMIWNKIDRTSMEKGVERDEYGKISRVRLSAKTGEGLEEMRQALIEFAAARPRSGGVAPAEYRV